MKPILIFWILVVTGCGSKPRAPFEPLTDRQPKVVAVSPSDGETIAADAPVTIEFSLAVDPKTVGKETFFVAAVPEERGDAAVLTDEVREGDLAVVEGSHEVSETGLFARFIPSEGYSPGAIYGIVVTPRVLSPDKIPLNQTPGEDPTPFFSSFYVAPAQEGARREENVQTQSLALAPSRPSHLQLNEIFYDAVGADGGAPLFIELTGDPEKEVGDYRITFVRGNDGTIATTLTVPPGMQTNPQGFFVIGGGDVSGADWVKEVDPPNGPNCVQLLDPDGKLLDALGYGDPLPATAQNGLACFEGTPAPDAPAGSSLSRREGEADANDNARDWMINALPSPGELR